MNSLPVNATYVTFNIGQALFYNKEMLAQYFAYNSTHVGKKN